jgi:hypothetical protein
MGGRFKGPSLHHRRSDLRHLDRFAAAILLSARHLVELGLKAKLKVGERRRKEI